MFTGSGPEQKLRPIVKAKAQRVVTAISPTFGASLHRAKNP